MSKKAMRKFPTLGWAYKIMPSGARGWVLYFYESEKVVTTIMAICQPLNKNYWQTYLGLGLDYLFPQKKKWAEASQAKGDVNRALFFWCGKLYRALASELDEVSP